MKELVGPAEDLVKCGLDEHPNVVDLASPQYLDVSVTPTVAKPDGDTPPEFNWHVHFALWRSENETSEFCANFATDRRGSVLQLGLLGLGGPINHRRDGDQSSSGQESVLVGIVEFSEDEQLGSLRSVRREGVRLVRLDKVHCPLFNIQEASTFALVHEIRVFRDNWELDSCDFLGVIVTAIGARSRFSERHCQMVQTRPEIVDHVPSNQTEGIRSLGVLGPIEDVLVTFTFEGSLRGEWLGLEEQTTALTKCLHVFLITFQCQSDTSGYGLA
jgi:hypothetical protein